MYIASWHNQVLFDTNGSQSLCTCMYICMHMYMYVHLYTKCTKVYMQWHWYTLSAMLNGCRGCIHAHMYITCPNMPSLSCTGLCREGGDVHTQTYITQHILGRSSEHSRAFCRFPYMHMHTVTEDSVWQQAHSKHGLELVHVHACTCTNSTRTGLL